MKTKLFCTLLIMLSCIQMKANVLTAVKNGKWHDYTSWDFARIPHASDTIIIPDGITINISRHFRVLNASSNVGELVIFGELNLSKNVSLIIKDEKWINCFENGKLIGNTGAKIIVNEQLSHRFKNMNEKYQRASSNKQLMIQRFNIRLNDTLLTDFSILNHDNLMFVEVQHSYDGKSWKMLDRVKAFPNEANQCRFISLKKVARQDNVDFIRLVGFSNVGRPILLNISQLKHNYKKIENRKKLVTIPKSIMIFSLATMGSRFAKMMSTF